ncbi:ATP-binding cassette domain-containing protein [Nocardioides sp. LMS-CY]|uniref:Branched-chain amino acid transport system ATP-binding protein n=1 Tax=Nocardioides soli TaxID=1036020 RepID=A0A7W4W1Q3_9ACTN|nr:MULTISPECIES: ABC transporter ATP-binding protein [Nocardioides]MBB3045329.1 branched-chain amino acid transport system ATP-binding protein [Nocardioides soli]QWF22121.1 ATP-binding cassette domain-containing protein [Nocardioides sp. LMS-CY]
MLRCHDVSVAYDGLKAIENVSIEVPAHQTVGIVGPNGAGKTSLLHGVCGIVPLAGGTVVFDEEDVTGRPTPDLVRRGISLVPAARELFPNLSVHKNLRLGAHTHLSSRQGRTQAAADLERVLEMFPILRERGNQAAGSLSGGQQQMVAIGRALMARPRLLVLDEPSLGLAPLVLGEIFDALHNLVASSDVSVLLVEQNAELTTAFVDYVYVLDSGRVVNGGPASEMTRDDIARAYMGAEA